LRVIDRSDSRLSSRPRSRRGDLLALHIGKLELSGDPPNATLDVSFAAVTRIFLRRRRKLAYGMIEIIENSIKERLKECSIMGSNKKASED
jgi:hypothetical protein